MLFSTYPLSGLPQRIARQWRRSMSYYGDNEYWAEPYTTEVDQLDLVNMGQYNVQDAKTRLSELLTLVENGEDVVIAKAGRPVARLVKIERPNKRELGFLAPLRIPDEFYEPWTDEETGTAG